MTQGCECLSLLLGLAPVKHTRWVKLGEDEGEELNYELYSDQGDNSSHEISDNVHPQWDTTGRVDTHAATQPIKNLSITWLPYQKSSYQPPKRIILSTDP